MKDEVSCRSVLCSVWFKEVVGYDTLRKMHLFYESGSDLFLFYKRFYEYTLFLTKLSD